MDKETEYTKGYRDGFKDGFQAGSKSDEILVTKKDATHKNCELSKSDKKLLNNVELASKVVLKEDEKLFKELAKEQKGCGRVLDYGEQYKDYYGIDEELHCGDTFKGKLELCPKCKENAPNHSQQVGGSIRLSNSQGKADINEKTSPDTNIHTEIKKEILKDYEN